MGILSVSRSQLGVAYRSQLGVLSRAPAGDTVRYHDSDGNRVWQRYQYEGLSSVPSNPATYCVAVSGDMIVGFALGLEQNIVGWDENGKRQWKKNVPFGFGAGAQALTLANGYIVYFRSAGTYMTAIDPSDGSEQWTTNLSSSGMSPQSLAVSGNTIIWQRANNAYWVLDGTTGTITDSGSYASNQGGFRQVVSGGIGSWTAARWSTNLADGYSGAAGHQDTFEGLDLDGTENGTEFYYTHSGKFLRNMILTSGGNFVCSMTVGDVTKINSSGTLLQTDASTFVGGPYFQQDSSGNVYAYGYSSFSPLTTRLVKYSGEDISNIVWSEDIDRPGRINANSYPMAIHSPASNPAPVVCYRYPDAA